MSLERLTGHPGPAEFCECGHSGNDHSHILLEQPCLECACWSFTFYDYFNPAYDGRDSNGNLVMWGQAVGMGIVDSRRLVPFYPTSR